MIVPPFSTNNVLQHNTASNNTKDNSLITILLKPTDLHSISMYILCRVAAD